MRDIANALIYILKGGIQWRQLPNDFPPYRLVYYYFSKWKRDGTFEKINQVLNRKFRKMKDRDESPSICIIDSQSIRNSERGLPDKGYDGYKKIKGRKRHIVVDTFGLLLAISVTEANVHDSKGAVPVLENLVQQNYERLTKVLADNAYLGGLANWIKKKMNLELEISAGLTGASTGFIVIPQRWKVERTFGWFNWDRRLSKDYESNMDSSEAFAYLSNINRVLKKF